MPPCRMSPGCGPHLPQRRRPLGGWCLSHVLPNVHRKVLGTSRLGGGHPPERGRVLQLAPPPLAPGRRLSPWGGMVLKRGQEHPQRQLLMGASAVAAGVLDGDGRSPFRPPPSCPPPGMASSVGSARGPRGTHMNSTDRLRKKATHTVRTLCQNGYGGCCCCCCCRCCCCRGCCGCCGCF